MPNIGPLEIAGILIVVLLIFGSKKLPELGRSVGRGMREFKESVTGNDEPRSAPKEIPSPVVDQIDDQAEKPLEGEVVDNPKS